MATIIRSIVEHRPGHAVRRVPVVRCGCGHSVACRDTWANMCDNCETEFNGAGQTLAPRSQWGEETGEHFGAAEREGVSVHIQTSGGSWYQNNNGRCEDAPCCGCCTF